MKNTTRKFSSDCNHKWYYYIHHVEDKNPEEFTCCEKCGLMLPFEGSVLEHYYRLKWYNRTME